MQQAQRACPCLRSLPNPVSRGDRPRKWVASLLPNQPRPRNLGLFPAPLLPTPLGPTLSGERPMALGVPRECCSGAAGERPTALTVGGTGKCFLGAALWSSDKTCNSTCWPQYWVFLSGLLGRQHPSWFFEVKEPQNNVEVCGPAQGGSQVRESQSNLYQDSLATSEISNK